MSRTACQKSGRAPRATRVRSRSGLWLVAGAVVVTGLVGSACGADNSSTGSTTTTAPTSSLPTEALRSSVEHAMSELKVPGAVALVASPDDQWVEAFGTRTVKGAEPVTTDDSFRVGSITKTMTGTVILQLVQEGKLRLDDHVSKFYAGIPSGDTITIADLLDMHSGLPSYTQLEVVNRAMDGERSRAWTPEELVALGAAQPVLFPPGERYDYSNTNTVLLGLIATKITGKDISTLLTERIFTPLGLMHTVMPPITSTAMPDPHPHGYMYGTNVSTMSSMALPVDQQAAADAGTLAPNDYTDLNPSWAGAAGAAISTVGDLRVYAEALADGRLLDGPVQQERLASVKPMNPDEPSSPGYGLALASFGPMLGHAGALPGFQAFMAHDPQRHLTVVVLTNLQASPSGVDTANTIARGLVDILYSKATTSVPADDDH
ncbi:MAG TPA: serine hydrolase domain-containing protein [Acidimicrobiales bacterium]|jgi:D-alanyl-D-alanine carboxypeptidase